MIKDGIPIESSQGPVKCAWLLRRDEEIPIARLPKKKNELPRDARGALDAGVPSDVKGSWLENPRTQWRLEI